jgi:ribonuclease Z
LPPRSRPPRAFIQSGEIAQRHSEVAERTAGGPAELINTITFEPKDEPQTVWSSGDVKVSAIRSTHIVGHASCRVDTPAGSVVIGGDAGSDLLAPPRTTSTSEQVEKLARGADVSVHSTIHPIMGPDKGSGMFPYAYYRQSAASDLGAMAKRVGAKYLMLTHLIPPIGADQQYPFKVPGKIDGGLRHAGYIASWISLLKADSRAFFTAASKAQAAADYLRGVVLAESKPEAIAA